MHTQTALWVVQIILGIKLLNVAYTHGLRRSQPAMQDTIRKMGQAGIPVHYVIAISAFVGAMGLILPGVFASPTLITSFTAILLSIMLLSSIFFHIRSREKPNIFVSLILFVFALFVAYGRRGFTP